MPRTGDQHLTVQQQKWFASVRDGLERETGKPLAAWVAIAAACPETAHRARLRWFKEKHGLLQNRASYVLGEAFPAPLSWSEPQALRDALWTDQASRAILEAVEAQVLGLADVVTGQRKGYSAWSRRYQFAALRPLKAGRARLGLAIEVAMHPGFEPARKEGWSERLKASLVIGAASEVDAETGVLLREAWQAS